MKNSNQKVGMGIFEVIFVVFLILKLTGLVNFSWLIVFSPLIIQALLIITLTIIFYFSFKLYEKKICRKK